jgi:hypothetical protein
MINKTGIAIKVVPVLFNLEESLTVDHPKLPFLEAHWFQLSMNKDEVGAIKIV